MACVTNAIGPPFSFRSCILSWLRLTCVLPGQTANFLLRLLTIASHGSSDRQTLVSRIPYRRHEWA
ncbi:hypothetical protein SCLCIDRAFT_1224915 [Scleroderma citrinum Foug A]|uniref:Uncharacterized protein n=1 Tax=Scleroderma citrinum Foug A TaxID=1036808 RepID=A0A0C3CQY3_9AGAM|nr:hypothetical protein SCLCIDRAFT_1224915 [Scleroderma citrinum Foug A]